MDILDKIRNYGIVPVIDLSHEEDAEDLARALCKGGLSIAEITFRSTCAKQVMVHMKKACPSMIIGAGTVLNTKQVDEAIDAGAEFIVSPGLNPNIVKYCQLKGIVIIPGCATPSDIENALSFNIHIVKFFPAEANGGLSYIQSIAAPYKGVQFMPTGGLNESNIVPYLQQSNIFACGGTWMVEKKLLEKKDFQCIEKKTKRAIYTMLDLKISNFDGKYSIYTTSQKERVKFHLENMGIILNDQFENDHYKIRIVERSQE